MLILVKPGLVLISLIVGKTLGVFSFGCLSELIGFGLPRGMRRRDLLVAGVIAGTGFTVALFVAGEAFSDPVIKGAAKMGAMLSVLAIPEYASWAPYNRAFADSLKWQKDVWHIPEFFPMLTQQQEQFDKMITGQIGAKAALDSAAAFQDKMLRDAGRIK